MSKKNKFDQYEDFWQRAFEEADIKDILAEGGQTSLHDFKQSSKKHIKEAGYWKAMFGKQEKLGKKIYDLFFSDENIARNKNNRLIVATGKSIEFEGKLRKGGQFLPKKYFEQKIKKK